MEQYSVNELRKSYLDFFASKDHLVLPSFSLVPKDDNSLLLISAGMAPLKSYFTGAKVPPRKRIATCQKCVRTVDIDNVGKTSRHATFFEMLGNFSFGDYFKAEIIPWAWEYLTEVLHLPKDRLYATVYLDDDEAFELWATKTDIGRDRIFRLGKAENFWEIGTGPCGPCSEIHYDYGHAGVIRNSEEFMAASEADKTVEIWNLVFTQFDKDEAGNYNPLPKPNIDTGMGLERLSTIMQGVNNIFEIDAIRSILQKVEDLVGVKYGEDKTLDISLRIVTDHIKSAAMLIGDGVLPSNEGRGYILRRLLRRAARHGRIAGRTKPFLADMIDAVALSYGEAYPLLIEKQEYIKKIVALEEEKFNTTLDTGMNVLKDYMEGTKGNVFSGAEAFKLYDTYGFPLELTEEIVGEKGLTIDYDRFKADMKQQKERARAARGESNFMGQEDSLFNSLKVDQEFEFTGYGDMAGEGNILLLADDEGIKETLEDGQSGYVILDRSPFYAEMGGQVGDTGVIRGENFLLEVTDTRKNALGAIINTVKVLDGTAAVGHATSEVTRIKRQSTMRNHTATHLLHKALKTVLGDHVNQAGSLVDETKLRFDFNHFNPLTAEEIQLVETQVNEMVMMAVDVKTEVMTLDEARDKGAMALFDAKYGESVRVVSTGDLTMELCGGTHVQNTGQIGMFKITSETGIAAGIRRIEGATGWNTIGIFNKNEAILKEISGILKTNEKGLEKKVVSLLAESKDKDKEIAKLKKSLTGASVEDIFNNVREVNGIKVISAVVNDLSIEELRDITEKALDRIVSGVSVMAAKSSDKVNFCVMVSKDLAGSRAHAGKIIGEIAKVADGKGGGRPDMAQAGGKNPDQAQAAVNRIYELLK